MPNAFTYRRLVPLYVPAYSYGSVISHVQRQANEFINILAAVSVLLQGRISHTVSDVL